VLNRKDSASPVSIEYDWFTSSSASPLPLGSSSGKKNCHAFNLIFLGQSENSYFPTVDLENLSLADLGNHDMHLDNLGMPTSCSCNTSKRIRISIELHYMSGLQFLRGPNKVGRIYGFPANPFHRNQVRVG